MKGTLLDFSIQTNEGIITGQDNNRYKFTGAEWKENVSPSRGQQVDFEVSESGQAVGIYLEYPAQALAKKQISASTGTAVELKDEENYNLLDWSMKCMRKYVDFSGRARRKEYWYFYLFQIIVGFGLGIIAAILDLSDDGLNGIMALMYLVFLLPNLSVLARRLHDVNRSGWWMLISLTIIGLIPLFIWLVSETKQESNQWGQPAK